MKRILSGLALASALLIGSSAVTGCSAKSMPEPKPASDDDGPSLTGDPLPQPKALKAGLIITSSPSVEIEIDGKSVGTTPLEVNDLEPGSHDVTFMFDGDDRMTQTVTLGDGETQRLNQNVAPDSSDAIMGGKN